MTASAASHVLLTLDDLRAAQRLLAPVVHRTPLLPLHALGEELGAEVMVKPESLQRGGAFKFRGAYHYLARMDPAERARGVIAPSSGNHAQAVALAAKLFGIPATVVMPTTVTPAKLEGCRRLGARVELAGTTTADRFNRALELSEGEGLHLVPPYDHPWIIAGQGTAGLEIAEDMPDVGTVIVPVGGGGLSAGVATAIKALVPGARVIGVEPEGSPKLTRAREAGEPVKLAQSSGLPDGLLAVEIGHLNFAHHREHLDDVVLVSDELVIRGMRHLMDRAKLVVEPSGAVCVAALMAGLVEPRGRTVAMISGGNIEWDGLLQVLGR
ncbi:MAG: Threonine dehydratase, catabolic [Gemmatimonadetes bacterium]|nr:Threonine dehydratase, catabolic [Gemmatimonadota bacterium]